jgi:hypothetical protein
MPVVVADGRLASRLETSREPLGIAWRRGAARAQTGGHWLTFLGKGLVPLSRGGRGGEGPRLPRARGVATPLFCARH